MVQSDGQVCRDPKLGGLLHTSEVLLCTQYSCGPHGGCGPEKDHTPKTAYNQKTSLVFLYNKTNKMDLFHKFILA
jgi:hypothetical protein